MISTPPPPYSPATSSLDRRPLVIGFDGMLGRAWCQLLDNLRIPYDAPTLDQLNFTNPQSILDHVTSENQLIINCAAYTDVDACESNYDTALLINATAVGQLADRCAQTGAFLIHYSTDYVFNGSASSPYSLNAPIDPVNAYGRSKAEGEQQITQSRCPHLIIRTSWLYAPWAKNFVRTIAKLAAEKPSLRVVNDQRGRPTSAQHLAAASLDLYTNHASAFQHVTDAGQCTWFDFASRIAHHVNPACRVEPCTSADFPRPAKRPAYSVLDIDPAQSLLDRTFPTWQNNLDHVLRNMEP